MSHFSPEERALLAPYVTDPEADIFAVKGLDGIVGAAYARYSRAPGGFRETLLKEFIKEGNIDPAHAQDLIERVLIAYGDDSVGELEGAHVSFEDISILATKELEDRRIGGSPIEQSTRYVFYDQKDAAGNFRYYRDPAILASPLGPDYIATMDFIFSTYASLVEPMQEFYRKLKPMDVAEYDINGDGVKERLLDCATDADSKAFQRTYKTDIRTKACDSLRALLPLATQTNVGYFGNGRFFQSLVSHCLTTDIPEVQRIADDARTALNGVIPRYVKRAKRSEYQAAVRGAMRSLAAQLFPDLTPSAVAEGSIHLLDRGEETLAAQLSGTSFSADDLRNALATEEDALTLACMIFPYVHAPLSLIRARIRTLDAKTREEIIGAYIGNRSTRRDRPGRAFESGYTYTFDMLTDFGTYKDLERHRMATQLRQGFTPLLGFAIVQDLIDAGFADQAHACRDRAIALYEKLLPIFPEQAAYATLHGSLVRWVFACNDREAQHLIELRTTPQGHQTYRKASQAMHTEIAARSAWRAAAMKFVDHRDYFWSRADSEARQRAEEKQLDLKRSERGTGM